MQQLRSRPRPTIAAIVFVIVAALAILAIPHSGSPAAASTYGFASNGHPVVLVATSSPAPTATAAPGHGGKTQTIAVPADTTPVPTPTDTPAPAPTATPVPQPTATPAPSWHVVGSYSGSAAQTLPSFTTANPWQFEWTCTPPSSGPTEGFSFTETVDGTNLAGMGDVCTSSVPTSGTQPICNIGVAPGDACYGSHTYVVTVGQDGSNPMCAWTINIEEWH